MNNEDDKQHWTKTWLDVPHILLYAGFILGLIAIFNPSLSSLHLWEGAGTLVLFGVLGAVFKFD